MPLEIRQVRGLRDLRQFVALPYRLHAGTPWIPPLKLERYLFLLQPLNAYFKHADAAYYLARRDGRVVGRISAQIDRAYNEFHSNRWGMFGFLEFEEDQEVLDALLAAAESWLRERGCDRMVGPMDFVLNEESGVLIEGFSLEPLIRQPWHPPYYQQKCEAAGLTKAMDLFSYALDIGNRETLLPIIPEVAEQALTKHGITIRKMTRRSLRRDLDEFADVYNAAWSRNWGFVPLSKEDLDEMALNYQLVFDGDWFMVAENETETVAAAITIPGHQPGAQEDEGAAAAARLVVLPEQVQDHRPPAGRLSRGQARVPAHGRRSGAVHGALRHRGPDSPQLRRGGLDPREQPRHEPRASGDGRQDRQALPRLRAPAQLRRRLISSRASSNSSASWSDSAAPASEMIFEKLSSVLM